MLGVVGGGLIAAVLLVNRIPSADAIAIVAIALASALLAIAAGALLLGVARRRSIGSQAIILILVATVGCTVGAWGTAEAMFISEHDFAVLSVVLVTAGIVASLGALWLGRRIDRSVDRLVAATKQLGDGVEPVFLCGNQPSDLTRLDAQLRETSAQLCRVRERSESLEQSQRQLRAFISVDARTAVSEIDRLVPDVAPELRMQVDRLKSSLDDLLELS